MKTLRLLLGDQLNIKHSWFKDTDDNVVYSLFEMRQETDYVVHHIQKVIGFFAAMRQFSEDLKALNHNVIYFKINDAKNTHRLEDNLNLLVKENKIERFEYQEPDEYRLDVQLKTFCKSISIASAKISSFSESIFWKANPFKNDLEAIASSISLVLVLATKSPLEIFVTSNSLLSKAR